MVNRNNFSVCREWVGLLFYTEPCSCNSLVEVTEGSKYSVNKTTLIWHSLTHLFAPSQRQHEIPPFSREQKAEVQWLFIIYVWINAKSKPEISFLFLCKCKMGASLPIALSVSGWSGQCHPIESLTWSVPMGEDRQPPLCTSSSPCFIQHLSVHIFTDSFTLLCKDVYFELNPETSTSQL